MSARFQNKRVWLGGGVFVGVVILAVGWFGFISPQFTAAASTRSDTDSARAQNIVLQAKNNKLKLENEKAASLRTSLAAALAQLPSDGGLTDFTRQLSAQATKSSVTLTSITVGGATAVAGVAATTAAATETATTTTAATTAAAAPTAAASGGLVSIAITLAASGLCSNDLAFLKAIQVTGPRRALVNSSALAPAAGAAAAGGTAAAAPTAAAGLKGSCTISLQLTIFSNPLSPTAQAALLKLISGK